MEREVIDIRRNGERNKAIQEILSDGERLKSAYRFVVNNPYITLHDAFQIIIQRPDASICFSFDEWSAQDRKIIKGRKGIPYYDNNGNKHYVFDVADTHGENRYRRNIYPIKKILDGLDLLNGTEIADCNRDDYRIILSGVIQYLEQNEDLTDDDEIRNRAIAQGVAYSLYASTGFPKERGVTLKPLPYGLKENANLFVEIREKTERLERDINDAVLNKRNEVPVIDDIDEDYVTDEPVIKDDEQPEKEEDAPTILPMYAKYLQVQKDNPDRIVVFQVGDFYEIIGDKAEQAANILDLTLTSRNVGLPERVPMCGYPYHVFEKYTEKLLDTSDVVVVENDKEPVVILANSKDEENVESPNAHFIELSPEESAEIDRIFDEQEETDEESEEVEYDDIDDYDYEEKKKSSEKSKPENKGKPIWERRNRPNLQASLFDDFDTKTPEEELTEKILKRGSGVSGGKIRIYTEYNKNPYEKDFVRFLSHEYGIGGFGGPDGIDEMHDGKGIHFSKKNRETGETEIDVKLKWEQVATKIADLIDKDNYLNEEEQKEYTTLVRFRDERKKAKDDNELIKLIARQIVEYGSAHTYCESYSEYPHFLGDSAQFYTQHYEAVNEEIEKFDEVRRVGKGNTYPYTSSHILFKLPYCPEWQKREARSRQRDEKVKEYVDRFTRQCADTYKPTNDKNIVFTVTADELPDKEYLFLKDERDDFTKYFLKQKGVEDVDLSMQRIQITFDRKYI